jgi:hypothetical protein
VPDGRTSIRNIYIKISSDDILLIDDNRCKTVKFYFNIVNYMMQTSVSLIVMMGYNRTSGCIA